MRRYFARPPEPLSVSLLAERGDGILHWREVNFTANSGVEGFATVVSPLSKAVTCAGLRGAGTGIPWSGGCARCGFSAPDRFRTCSATCPPAAPPIRPPRWWVPGLAGGLAPCLDCRPTTWSIWSWSGSSAPADAVLMHCLTTEELLESGRPRPASLSKPHVKLTAWLGRNIAHHDRLVVANIGDANPDQPLGVLGVSFSRRSSDAIAHAGHPNGITPTLGAKVKFDVSGLITEFNNGPYGGAPDGCRIS